MPKTTQSMLTAQRLSDGRVVYRAADQTWVLRDVEAWRADPAAIDAAIEDAKRETEIVVEPYRIEVDVDEAGNIRHQTTRERIRAEGPHGVLRRFGYEESAEAEPSIAVRAG